MAQIKTSEHSEQTTFIEAVLWTYRLDPTFIRPLFFSVPNGAYLGGRSALQYAKLKREGFVNGVSDILYLQPRGPYYYLAIEMKTEERRREKGGGISQDQAGFIDSVSMAGGLALVCYGAEEAIAAFDRYMRFESRAASIVFIR
jgi:VRR-NUC domain-containing protein